jgi:uncharacterized protein
VTINGSERAYLDSSALVKLVVLETESEALDRAAMTLASRISSELAVVEVQRRARQFGAAAEEKARVVLDGTQLRPIDTDILNRAAAIDPLGLRSLDAIHLATALAIDDLDLFISYDERLNRAAAAAGLRVESPA